MGILISYKEYRNCPRFYGLPPRGHEETQKHLALPTCLPWQKLHAPQSSVLSLQCRVSNLESMILVGSDPGRDLRRGLKTEIWKLRRSCWVSWNAKMSSCERYTHERSSISTMISIINGEPVVTAWRCWFSAFDFVFLPRGPNLDIYTYGKDRRKSSTINRKKCFKNWNKGKSRFPPLCCCFSSFLFLERGLQVPRPPPKRSSEQLFNTFCVFNGILIVQQIIVINYFQFNGAGTIASNRSEQPHQLLKGWERHAVCELWLRVPGKIQNWRKKKKYGKNEKFH